MVLPVLEYCPIVIDGAPAWAPRKLQVLQNNCLRACNGINDPRDAEVNALHEDANLDPLETRRNKQLLLQMYKLSRKEESTVPAVRQLRNHGKLKLKVSRPIKDIYTKSPLHRGSRLWNRLDEVQHHAATSQEFHNSLTPGNLLPLEDILV